jgi:hypothetical protein
MSQATISPGRLRNRLGRIPRLPRISLSRKGFEVSGWLWIVDGLVQLEDIASRHSKLLSELDQDIHISSSSTIKPLLHSFLQDLLAKLERDGLDTVKDSIMLTMGNCKNRQCAASDTSWAQNEFTGCPINPPSCQCSFTEGQETKSDCFAMFDWHLEKSGWILGMIKRMLSKQEIWCARLDGTQISTAIFDSDCSMSIFTTVDADLDILKQSSAPHDLLNVISIEVSSYQPREGLRNVTYMGNWRHGMWFAPNRSMRRYTFDW